MIIDIDDARTANQLTIDLLLSEHEEKILRVRKHESRPIEDLVLCYRKCEHAPDADGEFLVRAISTAFGEYGQYFSGAACHVGTYVGNNPWGKGLVRRTTFCPNCGWAMDGTEITHVIVMPCDDNEWMQRMAEQCKMGELLDDDGKNWGITHEVYSRPNTVGAC